MIRRSVAAAIRVVVFIVGVIILNLFQLDFNDDMATINDDRS